MAFLPYQYTLIAYTHSVVLAQLSPKDLALAGHKAALAQQNHRPGQKPMGGPALAWPGYGPGLLYGKEIFEKEEWHRLKGKAHYNSLALLMYIQTITTLRIETCLFRDISHGHTDPCKFKSGMSHTTRQPRAFMNQ
jgi:hypothetical protein